MVKGFIAPNPVQRSNDALLILQSTNDKNEIHISIFNSSGQMVLQQKISGTLKLSTKQLASGTYQVEIRNGQFRKTWEMVKQ